MSSRKIFIALLLMPQIVTAQDDGTITFHGNILEETCNFEGVSTNGGIPSRNLIINLPATSVEKHQELAHQNKAYPAGRFTLHFSKCSNLTSSNRLIIYFYSNNPGNSVSNRYLFLPDNTALTAKNIGLSIQLMPQKDTYYITQIQPNDGVIIDDRSNENGEIKLDYEISYEKIRYSNAVTPGTLSSTITYEIRYN